MQKAYPIENSIYSSSFLFNLKQIILDLKEMINILEGNKNV